MPDGPIIAIASRKVGIGEMWPVQLTRDGVVSEARGVVVREATRKEYDAMAAQMGLPPAASTIMLLRGDGHRVIGGQLFYEVAVD